MEKYQVTTAKIIKMTNLCGTIYDVTVENEYLAKASRCGQFVHIDCGDEFVLREEDIKSISKNSPFVDMPMYGKILATFVGGERTY